MVSLTALKDVQNDQKRVLVVSSETYSPGADAKTVLPGSLALQELHITLAAPGKTLNGRHDALSYLRIGPLEIAQGGRLPVQLAQERPSLRRTS